MKGGGCLRGGGWGGLCLCLCLGHARRDAFDDAHQEAVGVADGNPVSEGVLQLCEGRKGDVLRGGGQVLADTGVDNARVETCTKCLLQNARVPDR